MKIAIMSDSHENEKEIEKAVSMIKKLGIKTVIHCGDLISPPMLEYFEGLKFYFVYGNNDGEKEGLKNKSLSLGFFEPKEILELELNGKKFFVAHEFYKLKEAINSNKYNYILYGHSHSTHDEKIKDTRLINPGALFRAPIHTFATLDLDSDELDFLQVS